MGKIRYERNTSYGCVGSAFTIIGPQEAFSNFSIKDNISNGGGGIAEVQMFRPVPIVLSEIITNSDLPNDEKVRLVAEINKLRLKRRSSKSILRFALAAVKIYPAVRTLVGDFARCYNISPD